MAISSVAIQSFEQVSKTNLTAHKGVDESQQNQQSKVADGEEMSVQESAQARRKEQNRVILEANYSVSLSSKNNPSSTLFKRAIDAINKELEPTLGKNATQKAYDEGVDFSPEATADRIVNFATSFFSLYQQRHNDKSLEEQLDSYIDLVGGGAEKGFEEAKDILTGLDVFNGDVEKNANKTHDLIFEGFEKFKQNVLEANKPAETDNPSEDS